MSKTTKVCVFIVVAIALFSLMGCGSTPTPTETTDTFLKALKSQDSKTLSSVYENPDADLINALSGTEALGGNGDSAGLDAVFEDQIKPKMMEFDYKLSNEQIKGDKATVDITIMTYKFGDAFTEFFSDYLTQAFALAFSNTSEEELNDLAVSILSEKIAKLNEKAYETTVPLTLTLKDKKWIVDELEKESDLLDAIGGGLMTSAKAISDAFSN